LLDLSIHLVLCDTALEKDGCRSLLEDTVARNHQTASRVNCTVAANLPPAIALMSRLVPISQLSSSTFTSILSRLRGSDRFVLMADGSLDEIQKEKNKLA